VEVLDLTTEHEASWSGFVAREPAASVYHTIAWRDLLVETYRYRPAYRLAVDRGEVCGVLPLMRVRSALTGNRQVGLPFSHHVPLLAHDEAGAALVRAALAGTGRRERLLLKAGRIGCGTTGVETQQSTALALDASEEALWKGASASSARSAVSQARRFGVAVVERRDDEAIDAYERLEFRTRKRQGSPPYPRGFFSRLFRLVDDAVLLVAEFEAEIVAGLVLLPFAGGVLYAYGASDERGRTARANDLLIWEAICWSRRSGARAFDFGSTPRSHPSLLKFKEKWGAQTTPLDYSVYPADAGAGMQRDGAAARAASSILRKLPDPIFGVVGPWLLRQVG
jgi:serine/alanine adding enzyme